MKNQPLRFCATAFLCLHFFLFTPLPAHPGVAGDLVFVHSTVGFGLEVLVRGLAARRPGEPEGDGDVLALELLLDVFEKRLGGVRRGARS